MYYSSDGVFHEVSSGSGGGGGRGRKNVTVDSSGLDLKAVIEWLKNVKYVKGSKTH